MKNFEKREETEEFLKNRPKEEDKTFCPLIKQFCEHRCVCYVGAGVRELSTGSFYIQEGGCQNAMFFEHTIGQQF